LPPVNRPRQFLLSALGVLAILAVAWGALAFGSVYRWAFTPLAIVCLFVGVVAGITEWRGQPPFTGLALALTAVAAAVAIQLVPLPPDLLARISPGADAFLNQYAIAYGSAAHPISLAPDSSWLGLWLFASFAAFLLGMTRLLSARGARSVVNPLVVLGVVLALVAIIQYALSGGATYMLKIYGFWQTRYRGSPFGPFINRNHFAGWMVMVLPLALGGAYAAWERGVAEAPTPHGFRDRLAWLSSPAAAGVSLMTFAALVMGVSLLMSQSRSGMAAFGVGIILFAGTMIRRQPSRRSRGAAIVATSIVLVGSAAWAGVDQIAQRVSTVSDDFATASGRLGAWADTTTIVRDFPATGTGLNTYGTAMIFYQTGDRSLHFQEAHNDYLQLAAEGGLLLGVPVLCAIALFVRDVRRRFREAPKVGTSYWLRVGAVIGLISIALQAVVEFSLQMPGNAALFAVIAAIALHRSPNLRARPEGRSVSNA
jgi:putative inorganic carbon (HCO3(-)) transporter